MIADQLQREQALDCTQSFIVQAPAGSGKTELLIQRYLALLARVEKVPEQIIAITFTRKAAQEMRTRIMLALNCAANELEPALPHRQKTWNLARAVLARDAQESWQLLQQPNRLAIHTIDGFCARLTCQMPLQSRLGALPQMVENSYAYYEEAAEHIWLTLSQQEKWQKPIKNVLLHLDNQLPRLKGLIADLLARREQWLEYVSHTNDPVQLAKILQKNLQHLLEDVLQQAADRFPRKLERQALELLLFSQEQCIQKNIDNDMLSADLRFTMFPSPTVDDLLQWKTLAHLVLTKEGEVRKTVNKNSGFPSKSEGKTPAEKENFDYHKKCMLHFLAEIKEYPLFIQSIAQVQQLPEKKYDADQQKVLLDLLEVLSLAVAELMVLFQQKGVSDFNQLIQNALQALGTSEEPTDLALILDYRIQHILVDEFQDTSIAQFRFLERLTTGWLPGDGRTLFLVGDPMQSIYRFRQAEVGLFLSAWKNGVGQVALTPLVLRVNFRSTHTLIDWINQHMAIAFPDHPDISMGAVPFTPAMAIHNSDKTEVKVHIEEHVLAEADRVLQLVQQALADPTQQQIAILVRARHHLNDILPLLQAAGIDYHAVEIEKLSHRAVLQDLLVLTRALLHPGDRLAWLALLRSPLCGLSLQDMTYLVEHKPDACIWDNLQTLDRTVLSVHAQQCLPEFMRIINHYIADRQRLPLNQWIRSVWIAVGGPHCYMTETTYQDAQLFFNLLEEIGLEAYTLLTDEWDEKLATLYAAPAITACRLHIMTMHKAKGLEFDTVILPRLHAAGQYNTKPLLTWWQRPREKGCAEVLMTPLQAVGKTADKLYHYIWAQQQQALALELTRLLYVAVTRAKTHLHLVGVVCSEENTGKIIPPGERSLLSRIWKEGGQVVSYKFGDH